MRYTTEPGGAWFSNWARPPLNHVPTGNTSKAYMYVQEKRSCPDCLTELHVFYMPTPVARIGGGFYPPHSGFLPHHGCKWAGDGMYVSSPLWDALQELKQSMQGLEDEL